LPAIECADERWHYGETRIRAIAVIGNMMLLIASIPNVERCAGSSACGMRTGRNGMPIVRRARADIDKAKLLAELATRPRPTEEEIEAQASEDGDAWTADELANAEPVHPPPSPEQVRALRAKLGLTQAQYRSAIRLHAGPGATIRATPSAALRSGIDAASGHRGRSGSGRARSRTAQGRLNRRRARPPRGGCLGRGDFLRRPLKYSSSGLARQRSIPTCDP
jgi:hypothetical protein